MYKRTSLLLFFVCTLLQLHAQVGIGTIFPNSSAKLDIVSTSQGVLLPRMTSSERIAISNPVEGLFVYQTNGTNGLYYFDGNNWRNMTTGFIPLSSGYAFKQNGFVSTFAGSTQGFADGVRSTAQFDSPIGMAVDGNGNVYVADPGNQKIRKIDAAGTVTTLAGSTQGFANGTGTVAQFSNPIGLAVDKIGNVYVADYSNHKIRKIDATGTVITLAGSTQGFADGMGSASQFNSPSGVAVDGSGNVFVTDQGNHKIRKIDVAGTVTTLAGSTEGFADGSGSTAQFSYPSGLAVDGSGNLYVTDQDNHKIRKINAAGKVTTLSGSTQGFSDGAGSTAQFNSPWGVAVDEIGNVYVGDHYNQKIRIIDAAGTVTTLAGGIQGFTDGAGTDAKFSNPYGLAVDSYGNVYVADQSNHKIRKIVF